MAKRKPKDDFDIKGDRLVLGLVLGGLLISGGFISVPSLGTSLNNILRSFKF